MPCHVTSWHVMSWHAKLSYQVMLLVRSFHTVTLYQIMALSRVVSCHAKSPVLPYPVKSTRDSIIFCHAIPYYFSVLFHVVKQVMPYCVMSISDTCHVSFWNQHTKQSNRISTIVKKYEFTWSRRYSATATWFFSAALWRGVCPLLSISVIRQMLGSWLARSWTISSDPCPHARWKAVLLSEACKPTKPVITYQTFSNIRYKRLEWKHDDKGRVSWEKP